MVVKNQPQSAKRPTRSPNFFPKRPSFDHVDKSSAMALTSSRRTGGGAYSKVCRNGFSTLFAFSVDDSAENGTDCWAVICVRGCNQLNNSNNFLIQVEPS